MNLALLLALGPLLYSLWVLTIPFHEWGHAWLARRGGANPHSIHWASWVNPLRHQGALGYCEWETLPEPYESRLQGWQRAYEVLWLGGFVGLGLALGLWLVP